MCCVTQTRVYLEISSRSHTITNNIFGCENGLCVPFLCVKPFIFTFFLAKTEKKETLKFVDNLKRLIISMQQRAWVYRIHTVQFQHPFSLHTLIPHPQHYILIYNQTHSERNFCSLPRYQVVTSVQCADKKKMFAFKRQVY